MKKICLTLALGCMLSGNIWGQSSLSPDAVCSLSDNRLAVENSRSPLRANQGVIDALACPAGTVHSIQYTEESTFTGLVSSDMARTDMSTRAYQSFTDNNYTVNGIRFLVVFSHYEYPGSGHSYCYDRGGIDEAHNMTEPIKFEISFYQDNNGMPGDEVYFREFELIGQNTGVVYDSYSGTGHVYAFETDLDETIALHSGWFSITATDMGDEPWCWINMFGTRSNTGKAMVETSTYGWVGTNTCFIYCFKGTGEMLASKSLKLGRFLNPVETVYEKYEKIQVELENAGSESIKDARLQLEVDGEVVAVEDVPMEIPVGEKRHYTFRARADFSSYGYHNVIVRNLTPGDEGICPPTLECNVMHPQPGMVCESKAQYFADYIAIENVQIGDINNASEASKTGYTDFTHISTDIKVGETLPLTVLPASYNIGAWVDWNDNGVFSDPGEYYGLNPEGGFNISVPSNVSGLKAGTHTLRVVKSYAAPEPCGFYQFGETEDYSLNIVINDEDPILSSSIQAIDETFDPSSSEGLVRDIVLAIGNDGGDDLMVNADVDYVLPILPKMPARANEMQVPGINLQSVAIDQLPAPAGLLKAPAAPKEEDTQFILRYDYGVEAAVGVGNYSKAVFGHYYPAEVLRNVKGMKVTSIDVYIAELPTGGAIEIYGAGDQWVSGNVLYTQKFTPVADSWNRIVLDKPFVIDGTDLRFGVRLEGMESNHYYIGIDGHRAYYGYSDVLNVGGNYWWPLTDLGRSNNLCIRVNVGGERSAAISWVNLDQKEFTVEPSGSVNLKASLDTKGLEENTVYEASIKLTSNDPLSGETTIPVYVTKTSAGAVNTAGATRLGVKMIGTDLVIESASAISSVDITAINGVAVRKLNIGGEYCAVISLESLEKGVYVATMTYGDGAVESIKIAVIH